jgi:hypothetical protein
MTATYKGWNKSLDLPVHGLAGRSIRRLVHEKQSGKNLTIAADSEEALIMYVLEDSLDFVVDTFVH